jgi:hypothetical protein
MSRPEGGCRQRLAAPQNASMRLRTCTLVCLGSQWRQSALGSSASFEESGCEQSYMPRCCPLPSPRWERLTWGGGRQFGWSSPKDTAGTWAYPSFY